MRHKMPSLLLELLRGKQKKIIFEFVILYLKEYYIYLTTQKVIY